MGMVLALILEIVVLYFIAVALVTLAKAALLFAIVLRHGRTSAWKASAIIAQLLKVADVTDEDTRKLLQSTLADENMRLFYRWTMPKMPETIEAAEDTILCRLHGTLKERYLRPETSYRTKCDCVFAMKWLQANSSALPWKE